MRLPRAAQPTRPRERFLLPLLRLSLLLVGLVGLALPGCGGDDDGPENPTAPPDAPVVRVPEDHPTIAAAVQAAAAGDTVSVAAGTYIETLSVEKSLVIAGREPGGRTVLEMPRVRIVLDTGEHVEMRDLYFSDGDTVIAAELSGGSVSLAASSISHSVLGILCSGSGSVVLDEVAFVGIGVGAGTPHGAIDVSDTIDLAVANCEFQACLAGEPGVVRIAESATFEVLGSSFAHCDADQAVVNVIDQASGAIIGSTFASCTPYTIRQRGDLLTVRDVSLVQAAAPAVGVGLGSRLALTEVTFDRCAAPVLEVGGQATWSRGSATASEGAADQPVLLLGRESTLSCSWLTIDDHPGPLAAAGGAADLTIASSLVTRLGVPLLRLRDPDGWAAPTLAVDRSDFWSPGVSAWQGLEDVRDAGEANLEADPRYCDADGGDHRLRPDSPCVVDGIAQCGAFAVGCE